MPIVRYTAKQTNDNVDPNNFQLIGFVMNNIFTDGANAMRILCYLSTISLVQSSGTRLVSISSRPAGSAGATDVPFDAASFATLKALGDGEGFPVGNQSAYNVAVGAGPLTPLGTSMSVSERTAFVGPRGRGRHFLGFFSRNEVTTGGRAGPDALNLVDRTYNYWMGLTAIGPLPAVTGVTPSNLGAFRPIIDVVPQPVLSNLESRRR